MIHFLPQPTVQPATTVSTLATAAISKSGRREAEYIYLVFNGPPLAVLTVSLNYSNLHFTLGGFDVQRREPAWAAYVPSLRALFSVLFVSSREFTALTFLVAVHASVADFELIVGQETVGEEGAPPCPSYFSSWTFWTVLREPPPCSSPPSAFDH